MVGVMVVVLPGGGDVLVVGVQPTKTVANPQTRDIANTWSNLFTENLPFERKTGGEPSDEANRVFVSLDHLNITA